MGEPAQSMDELQQTLPFPVGLPEGRRRRDAELEAHEERRKARLERVRAHLVKLGRNRDVTIDDARNFCLEQGIEVGMYFGQMFAGAHWVKQGYRQSAFPGNHARPVSVWRLDPTKL